MGKLPHTNGVLPAFVDVLLKQVGPCLSTANVKAVEPPETQGFEIEKCL
jgi:hypothetical protein